MNTPEGRTYHFDNWPNLNINARWERLGQAREEAVKIFKRSSEERRILEESSTDPLVLYSRDAALKDAKADARQRRKDSFKKPADPILKPVTAYYEERRQKDSEADRDLRYKSLEKLVASNDPMAQYLLEEMIREIELDGPGDIF